MKKRVAKVKKIGANLKEMVDLVDGDRGPI